MAATPSFASIPRAAATTVSVANANRDGTGTIVTLFTAGSSGSKIEEVRITPTVTTTAGMVRLFLHDGTNFHLFEESLVAARTLSATTAATTTALVYENLVLPSGWSLRVSTEKAEAIKIHAFGGDF